MFLWIFHFSAIHEAEAAILTDDLLSFFQVQLT